MNQELKPLPQPEEGLLDPNDPYRYGWRYVPRELPDGTVDFDQVPLTEEDVLHPEEDDFIVQTPGHTRDFTYLFGHLDAHFADDPDTVVLGDNRIDWGVARIRPHGPDLVVLEGVREWLRLGTFRVGVEGGRPVLVVEITSPSTRRNDLGIKLEHYFRVGIQQYVIVDRGPEGLGPYRLLAFRPGPTGMEAQPLDEQGRVLLDVANLLLGIEGERAVLYDPETGQRLPDIHEQQQALAAAQEQAEHAQEQADKAEEKARKAREQARQAKAKLKTATDAQAQLEERLRQVEDELRRLRESQGSTGPPA